MNQSCPQFKDAPQIDRINLAHAIMDSVFDKLDNLGLQLMIGSRILRKDNITIESKSKHKEYKPRAIS